MMRKTKRFISMLMVMIMLGVSFVGVKAVTANAASSTNFNHAINISNYKIGDIIYYYFTLESINEKVGAAHFIVNYDTTVLSYIEDSYTDPNNLNPWLIESSPGQIHILLTNVTGYDFSTKKIVVTARFKVISKSKTSATINGTAQQIIDVNGNEIDPTGKITVSGYQDYILTIEYKNRNAVVGQTLTVAVPHTGDGIADVTYQWQRSNDGTTWTNISGAQASSYTLTSNDKNKYVRVAVTSKGTNVSPGTATSYTLSVIQMGDVDKDGEVTIADVQLLQKYIAEMVTLTSQQKIAADVNRDGLIDLNDAVLIQKYVARIITEF